MRTEEKEIKYTPWVTFCWAIGILLTLYIFGLNFTISAKSEAAEAMKQSDKATNDVEWIKGSLNRIETKLNTK